jgi:hypothetical protein
MYLKDYKNIAKKIMKKQWSKGTRMALYNMVGPFFYL